MKRACGVVVVVEVAEETARATVEAAWMAERAARAESRLFPPQAVADELRPQAALARALRMPRRGIAPSTRRPAGRLRSLGSIASARCALPMMATRARRERAERGARSISRAISARVGLNNHSFRPRHLDAHTSTATHTHTTNQREKGRGPHKTHISLPTTHRPPYNALLLAATLRRPSHVTPSSADAAGGL